MRKFNFKLNDRVCIITKFEKYDRGLEPGKNIFKIVQYNKQRGYIKIEQEPDQTRTVSGFLASDIAPIVEIK